MSVEMFETIALRTGVSPRTVQRVLNQQGRDTRPSILKRAEDIRALAAKLGYRPNAAARAVATGRFHAAALLMTTADGRSHSSLRLLQGIHDALVAHNLHLQLAWLPDEQLVSEEGLPKVFREWLCDGLLINYNTEIPPAMVALIDGHHLPSVWINADRTVNCVRPDDEAAGQLAAMHLIERGYRRIGYLELGTSTHYSMKARRRGCTRALRAAGLTPRSDVLKLAADRLPGCRDSSERRQLLAAWLTQPDRPEAVVTYSSWTAEPLLHAAAEAGLRVPQDLAIVTVEDFPVEHTGRAITTVLLGVDELATLAVAMLQRKIASPDTHQPTACAAPVLVVGDTT